LIAAAREVTLVCDSTKLGSAGPVLISPLSVVDQVVTDGGISADHLAQLQSCDIEVVVV